MGVKSLLDVYSEQSKQVTQPSSKVEASRAGARGELVGLESNVKLAGCSETVGLEQRINHPPV